MKVLSGTALADWVRERLAEADSDIAAALAKSPQAVRASDDPSAIRTGWVEPDPFKVLVFTEYSIGDPMHHPHVYQAFDRVGKRLRGQLWAEDGGWESYNPAVQYFWVTPRQTSLKLNPARAAEGAPGLRRRANPTEYELGEIAGLIEMAMARTLWVTSYADWTENLREENERTWQRLRERGLVAGGGQDWDAVAPFTPPSANRAARRLVHLFEEENHARIDELLLRALAADGRKKPTEKYLELFGHYLVMEALGHGVSWFDDHKRFSIKFPRFEAFSPDGRTLDWSPH